MKEKVIKPKGFLYIFYNTILFIPLIGLPLAEIIVLLVDSSFIYNNPKGFVYALGLLFGMILFTVLLIIRIIELIKYKIVLYKDHLFLSANKDFNLTRQKATMLKFENITALQYKQMLRADLIAKGKFFFLAIYVTYANKKKQDYLLMTWFSKKQVKEIMEYIRINAERINGFAPEILPDVLIK